MLLGFKFLTGCLPTADTSIWFDMFIDTMETKSIDLIIGINLWKSVVPPILTAEASFTENNGLVSTTYSSDTKKKKKNLIVLKLPAQ